MAIQLQDFAKQVLFGTTIEDKLSFPREEIIDTNPGSAIKTPRELTRPPHLALREDGVKANHPSNAKLIDEKERGRLLHFFGNHELLATELMALVLLKFPEAPASFRQGVLETLKEEQIHTRIYMHRMKQCGVEFGELPLSDYFWKSVSSMEDPLDYVTRLSLTFEQANLDYSREYKKVFEAVGDDATASILDRIYKDEINHVGFGLKWFRRWKASGKTDWEAFRERLVFPLSPARAKGNLFNAEGRSEAGFDKAFVADLQLFNQSRGRTPSILWFNPDAEAYASQNNSDKYVPSGSVLQNDLAFLPAYLSRRDDLLVMANQPSPEFLRDIQNAGFHLPEILPSGDSLIAPDVSRKVNALKPWAWTPDSIAFFRNTFGNVTTPTNEKTLWNEDQRQLFSKAWSAAWGKRFTIDVPEADWTAPSEVYGELVTDFTELDKSRKRYGELGYLNIVCKAQFGTAANGLRCLLEGEEIGAPLRSWLHSTWREQGSILVEPWLNRVYDFSVQFELPDGDDLKTIAFTQLFNNARGQFQGILTNAFCKGCDSSTVRFLMQRVNGKPKVYRWYEEEVGPRLAQSLRTCGFSGPFGIDAFVYLDPNGALKLKSIVEINPRYTMGRVAHELCAHNAPGTLGFFQILTKSQIKKRGVSNIREYSEAICNENPVQFSSHSKPRILSGSISLNEAKIAKQYLAMYHVRKSFNELPLVMR